MSSARLVPAIAVSLLSLSTLLSGCGGGDANSATNPPSGGAVTLSPLEQRLGIWLAPAYGYALHISNDNGKLQWRRYDYTGSSCLLSEQRQLESAELLQALQPDTTQRTVEYREAGQLYSPGVVFSAAGQLPASCSGQRLATREESGYVPDAVRDLGLLWQTFADHYHDFTLSGVNWKAAQPGATSLPPGSTDAALFEAACAMVAPLNDPHVSIFYRDQSCTTTRKPMLADLLMREYAQGEHWQAPFSEAQQQAMQDYAAEGMALRRALPATIHALPGSQGKGGHELLNWFVTPDGYGYLGIAQFSGFSGEESPASDIAALEAALDQGLAQLGATKGLIIDVRYNPGGYDEAALRVVRRLLLQRTELYRKQARLGTSRTPLRTVTLDPVANPYRNPIAVLTSNSTFSAAEVFALSMRSRPNTVLIGDATGGALSDTLGKRGTGELTFTLSNEFYLSPRGEWFEGVGVPVGIAAAIPGRDEIEQQVDPGMLSALQWLRQNKP